MSIVCATESASWAFCTEKITDRVSVLVVRVDGFFLSIYPHSPFCKSLLMLDIDELRWHIVKRELLATRSAPVCADEPTEERGGDEYLIC